MFEATKKALGVEAMKVVDLEVEAKLHKEHMEKIKVRYYIHYYTLSLSGL
jgi:hypothetical protein